MESYDDQRPWLNTYPAWLPAELPVPNLSLLDEFFHSVAAYPADPCIHYFDRSLNYADIRQMAEALAGALADMGTVEGDRVIVLMQNIPQAVVACLAIWMRNAVVVPLNPMYTGKDLQHYLGDCGARLFICQDDLYEKRVSAALENRPDVKVITTSALDLLGDDQKRPGQFAGVTKQSWPGMALRRFRVADLKSGTPLNDELLFAGRQPFYAVDNMEGIAAHRTRSGETRITIISDDNYNRVLQATYIFQFAVE